MDGIDIDGIDDAVAWLNPANESVLDKSLSGMLGFESQPELSIDNDEADEKTRENINDNRAFFTTIWREFLDKQNI